MDKLQIERVSACTLNRVFGYEPRIASGLIRGLGSASSVFELSKKELTSLLGPFSKYRDRLCDASREETATELERLSSSGCCFVSLTEECYPSLLKECEDAPAGLYVRSSSPPEEIFNGRASISIVGTRDISLYGKEWCPRIVEALAHTPEPPRIVSGLAFGVDITAHMAATAFGLPTVAVLPVGIDDVYPSAHRVAAEKIAASPGSALITDYPPHTGAVAVNFLRRNRIIAGLSAATILVESKIRGGGMMTARLAFGYGRDVLVLPGRIDDIRSQGCNLLIHDKIAEPIVSLEALGGILGLGKSAAVHRKDIRAEVLERYGEDGGDGKLLSSIAGLIAGKRGITVEEIGRECGIGYGKALSLAGMLESDGFIDTDLLQRCTIHVKKA